MKKIIYCFILLALGISACDQSQYDLSRQQPKKKEIPPNQPDSVTPATEDDLMMKLINKEIKAPMDSLMTVKCFNYMKTNYSLMTKLMESPFTTNKDVAKVAMVNYAICINVIDLMEKSPKSVTGDMKNELKNYKNKIDLMSPKFLELYKKYEPKQGEE